MAGMVQARSAYEVEGGNLNYGSRNLGLFGRSGWALTGELGPRSVP
jgi:hypothetical protein